MAQITVTINGKSFRMACDDGEEERLMGLAARFDGWINDLRGAFGEIGDQRLTVMAGIMAALQSKQQPGSASSTQNAASPQQRIRFSFTYIIVLY